jgi:putative drug exporter of the RND superfamily
VLGGLGHFVYRRRKLIVVAWIGLAIFGAFSASQVSKRWLEQFSIPGYPAYEANQRTLKTFGTGEQPPLLAVFTAKGDVTKQAGIPAAIAAAAAKIPGSRVGSTFSTGSKAYVSRDGHTTFATIYPPRNGGFSLNVDINGARKALLAATPQGVTAHLTGRDPLQLSEGGGGGPSVLTEALIGGIGALIILLFVFGTLPAMLMPILAAACSILVTFSLVWGLTYITSVSIIVQFLVALVGLGVAIDYSLLMIFRFREELKRQPDVETAIVETMTHAGRSVIVSGSTVAIGLLSLVILPIPVIRSVGIGGMLIPAVSVVSGITLVPALLSILGLRLNSLRVMPKGVIQATDAGTGFWWRWARFVTKHPIPVALTGLALCGLLLIPALRLNPSEAQMKDLPGRGDAVAGRAALTASGFSLGVMKPFVILVENGAAPGPIAAKVAAIDGVDGAVVPTGPGWQKGGSSLIEAFPSHDGAAKATRTTIQNVQAALAGTSATLGGVAAEDRDFVHAVYGNFLYMLAFVILLTFFLLMRAFRSIVLPLKAVVVNLISLGAAYGIIVLIFQEGHGSEAIWGVHATNAIIAWIPLMIFAFLYGLSMDYEVFMLTRMREAYDEVHDTNEAITIGLARTGKLVTSAALVLMFAFFVLSTGPSVDIKQFGIGLAAGIIFDATVIRALLVPSIMTLMGSWNWWLPEGVARVLRVPAGRRVPESA